MANFPSRNAAASALAFFALTGLVSGCARLHSAQIGEIDGSQGYRLRPFDVKVSEIGISTEEATRTAKAFASDADKENIGQIGAIIALFQMGPKTGKPVYDDSYAENLVHALYKECPSGTVTGLMPIRETMDYPVVSGEIVRITGYCREKKRRSP